MCAECTFIARDMCGMKTNNMSAVSQLCCVFKHYTFLAYPRRNNPTRVICSFVVHCSLSCKQGCSACIAAV